MRKRVGKHLYECMEISPSPPEYADNILQAFGQTSL